LARYDRPVPLVSNPYTYVPALNLGMIGRETRDARSSHQPSEAEERTQREDEAVLLRCFRKLGCIALRRIRPGNGSSIHYAGTFPITREDRPLTCDRDSRLRGTRSVYLADGSVFPWLPPEGLTFNIMANADRVGAILAERLG
jgi:choline dehydrogenase-like flavoprotein